MELYITYAIIAIITLIVVTDFNQRSASFTTKEAIIIAALWPVILFVFIVSLIIALIKP